MCDHPSVELATGERSVEDGVTEGEHAPVGRSEPVAPAVLRGCQGDDRRGQRVARERSGVAGVAEGEDAAVRSDQPIAASRGSGRHVDHPSVEVGGRRATRGRRRPRKRKPLRRQPRASSPGRRAWVPDRPPGHRCQPNRARSGTAPRRRNRPRLARWRASTPASRWTDVCRPQPRVCLLRPRLGWVAERSGG